MPIKLNESRRDRSKYDTADAARFLNTSVVVELRETIESKLFLFFFPFPPFLLLFFFLSFFLFDNSH